jgi:beta-galactosidase beta subunit
MSYFRFDSQSDTCVGKFYSPAIVKLEKKCNSIASIKLQFKANHLELYYNDFDGNQPSLPNIDFVLLRFSLNDTDQLNYQLLESLSNPINNKNQFYNLSEKYPRIIYGSVLKEYSPDLISGNKATFYDLVLCLFDDLNNTDSELYQYNAKEAASARRAFEKSEIYRLIISKQRLFKTLYYLTLVKQTSVGKATGLNTYFQDFEIAFKAYLKDVSVGKIQEIIPAGKMGNKEWFYTPEKELLLLSKIHSEYLADDYNSKSLIRNTLLAKHDVIKTLNFGWQWAKWTIVILHSIAFVCFITVFAAWSFYGILFGGHILLSVGACSFILALIIAIISQWKFKLPNFSGALNIILPRILVAVSTGWFIMVASEEILKNQIDLNPIMVIVALITAFILTSVFLIGEVRQHSPYAKPCIPFLRMIIILVYTFNFAVLMGIVLHTLIVDGYVKNSKVYVDVVCEDTINSLQAQKNIHENYRDNLLFVQAANVISFSVLQKQDMVSKVFVKHEEDTIYYGIASNTKYNPDNSFINDFVLSYNNRVVAIKKSVYLQEICENANAQSAFQDSLINMIDKIQLVEYRAEYYRDTLISLILHNDKIFSSTVSKCEAILNIIDQKLLVFSNDSILMDKYTYKHSASADTNNGSTAKYHRYYMDIFIFGKWILYPYMLIFQVAVIMMISILGQLIISEKTTTEAL